MPSEWQEWGRIAAVWLMMQALLLKEPRTGSLTRVYASILAASSSSRRNCTAQLDPFNFSWNGTTKVH